jgi:hypothetical protein
MEGNTEDIAVRLGDETRQLPNQGGFLGRERQVRISLGRDPARPQHRGLACDISVVTVLSDDSLIAELNPMRVQQGKLLDIAPGLPPADFTGKVTPFLSGFEAVFMFPNTLRNFLPRLQCVERNPTIDLQAGCRFLHMFFAVLIEVVKNKEDCIDSHLIFPVLSSFLANLDGQFLDSKFMNSLVTFFGAFSNEANRRELVQALFSNAYIIADWPDQAGAIWFATVLTRLSLDWPDAFQFTLVSFIYSILIISPTQPRTKKRADRFLVHLIEQNNDQNAVEFLAQFAIWAGCPDQSQHCANILAVLARRLPHYFDPEYTFVFLQLVRTCGAFEAFLEFWKRCRVAIPNRNLAYLLIALLKQSGVEVKAHFLKEFEPLLSPETFPLFAHLLTCLPDRSIAQGWFESKFDRTWRLGQHSFHWLVLALEHAYGFEDFTQWHQVLTFLTPDELRLFFHYLDLHELQHSISFKALKRELLITAMLGRESSEYLALVLEFLLCQLSLQTGDGYIQIHPSIKDVFDVLNQAVVTSCTIGLDFQNDHSLIDIIISVLLIDPLARVRIGSSEIEMVIAAAFLVLQTPDE